MAKLKKVARSFADRLRESPYGGYDPKKDPYVKRHPARQGVTYNSDKNITQDILRNVGTTGRNLAALTLGLPGDIQDISALKDAPRQLPNSEQLAKTFGGDPNHPSWLPASLIAPGPGEAKAGMNLLAKIGGNIDPTWAMTLFHGTPHRFKQFELSPKTIHTGEGNTSFGHGLYFAENPGVARSYQSQLSGFGPFPSTDKAIANALTDANGDRAVAAKFLRGDRNTIYFGSHTDLAEEAAKKVESGYTPSPKGHLYEVEIPDEITERMLDWDAPLSEQPGLARVLGFADPDSITTSRFHHNSLASEAPDGIIVSGGGRDVRIIPAENGRFRLEGDGPLGQLNRGAVDEKQAMTVARKFLTGESHGSGEMAYDRLVTSLGSKEAASAKLREAGIPGIRFFDGSSRGVQGKTVYHGTTNPDLTAANIDPKKAIETEGAVFFTDNEGIASQFAYEREYGELLTSDIDEYGDIIDIEPGPIIPARLDLKKPLELTGADAQEFIDDSIYQGQVIARAKKAGHDGVVAKNVHEFADPLEKGDVFAVFDKSSIQPEGTRNIVVFDPEDITQVKRDGQEVYKKGLADVARQDIDYRGKQ